MAKGIATRPWRGLGTICAAVAEELSPEIVNNPREFQRTLDQRFPEMPEPRTSRRVTNGRTDARRPGRASQ